MLLERIGVSAAFSEEEIRALAREASGSSSLRLVVVTLSHLVPPLDRRGVVAAVRDRHPHHL